MTRPRLKIAYLCDADPRDRTLYSGGNARMFDALQKHVGDVTVLPQDWGAAEPVRRAILRLPESALLRLRWRAHLALAPVIARRVRRALVADRYDVLFGAYAFHALHRVRTPYALVTAFTSDATQTLYRNSEIGQAHPSKFPGGRALDGWVEACERRVFQNADLTLWPSQWLKDGADALYGLVPARSHLVPWGAGIAPPPPPAPRPLSLDAPVRLLLVGRDWWAKGGPIAFDTMKALRDQGIDARLTVIGCVPPDFHQNEYVTIHPSLDKSVPGEARTFAAAYGDAHFLIQPSFESYGFAFCEASAHGLPSLCLRVGGVPVRDGINGHALPIGGTPAEFASIVRRYLDDPAAYAALTRSAREEYEERLNWDAWGRTTAALLHDAVARQSR